MPKSCKSKKKNRGPNLSPLSLLRPRLDGLWNNPTGLDQDEQKILADLNAVTKGIDPADYLPVVVKAYGATTQAMQEQLAPVIPKWLTQSQADSSLETLVMNHTFEDGDQTTVLNWLQQVGVDTVALAKETESTFYKGFLGADDLGSQGTLMVFWYANRRRSRVQGLGILIDYNPPWEGAAKDLLSFPQRAPQQAVREFTIDVWGDNVLDFEELDAVEAKKAVIDLFLTNREERISLHRDFIAAREVFAEHIFTLPDDPDTPPFTVEDFDALVKLGQRTEDIMKYEQTVGRRVRMEGGQELLVGAANFDDDEW